MTLLVHRGGWEPPKADLATVQVPEPTESYHPVPYGRFVEEVELHLPRFGLTVGSSSFALAQTLAELVPDPGPAVLAIDQARGWMLMRDGGPTLRSGPCDLPHVAEAVRQFAQMQMHLATHV